MKPPWSNGFRVETNRRLGGAPTPGTQRAEKRYQVLFLLRRQLGTVDQVEEFDRVFQCQKALVVQVRRVVLGAAQYEGFVRPVPDRHHIVDHHRLEEALGVGGRASDCRCKTATGDSSHIGPC